MCAGTAFAETPDETAARIKWFTDARFGMFIHFIFKVRPVCRKAIRKRKQTVVFKQQPEMIPIPHNTLAQLFLLCRCLPGKCLDFHPPGDHFLPVGVQILDALLLGGEKPGFIAGETAHSSAVSLF